MTSYKWSPVNLTVCLFINNGESKNHTEVGGQTIGVVLLQPAINHVSYSHFSHDVKKVTGPGEGYTGAMFCYIISTVGVGAVGELLRQ